MKQCHTGSCIEIVNSGGDYFVLDTKNYGLGPLAVLSALEFKQRITLIGETGDATHLLYNDNDTSREQVVANYSLEPQEFSALSHYVQLGTLDNGLPERGSFTAYSDRREAAVETHQLSVPDNVYLGRE